MGFFAYELALDDVERVFQRYRWGYRREEELLFTVFDHVPMVFLADADLNVLMLFSQIVPGEGARGAIAATPERAQSAQAYLLAANYRLTLGTFSRDHRDGEIRYECSQVVPEPLSDDLVHIMVIAATGAVTRHGPTIIRLLRGQTTLPQALAALERDSDAATLAG
ncbi:MAG TPA: hypothetical protein VFY89_07175 [Ktedonobacterales bacterium]